MKESFLFGVSWWMIPEHGYVDIFLYIDFFAEVLYKTAIIYSVPSVPFALMMFNSWVFLLLSCGRSLGDVE